MEKGPENRYVPRERTVEDLDIDRYMGQWYEIARFDHRFERGMDNVTTQYERTGENRVKVTNSGFRNGKRHLAHGKARIPDLKHPGKLEVSFFLWFYADYYVMELGEDYSYALVGSSTDKYLWILARTPYLPQKTLEHLLACARERGYDTSKLIWVEQQSDGGQAL